MTDPTCHRALRRFWFETTPGPGVGVTAASAAEARALAVTALAHLGAASEITRVTEDVDVSTLDARHVLPNIGPPAVRGIWFPALNL